MSNEETTTLSKSLVYLISPRGGDNFWARVIASCNKTYVKGFGTLAVSIAPNGQYMLTVDPDFFDSLSPSMQKLVLIHEAGHLSLRHIERLVRILSLCTDKLIRLALFTLYNIAMDLADNDAILRKEKEFADVVKNGEFHGLLPEQMGFPEGLSMEEYMGLLLKDLNKVLQQMQKIVDEYQATGKLPQLPGEGESGDGDEEGEGDGQQKQGKGGKGKKKQKQQAGGQGDSGNSDMDDPMLPQGLAAAAHHNPGLFQELMKAFQKITGGSHNAWNEILDKLTPEEGHSLANKMKRHAKRLVATAKEQTTRTRGSLPAGIESLIESLLAPEQIPWHLLLDDAVAGSVASKLHEEMAMPNLSLLPDDGVEPWPGYMLDPQYNITWITDVSGSVSDREFARACNAMNALMRANKSIKLRHIQIDTCIQHEEMTDNLVPPDEKDTSGSRRYGAGGTTYTSAFKRILGVDDPSDWTRFEDRLDTNPSPDLIVVFTDGGVCLEGETFPKYKPTTPIIWLVAPGCSTVPGMSDVSPDRVIQMFEIHPEF